MTYFAIKKLESELLHTIIILTMTTLQKSGFGHLEHQKHFFETLKLKNATLKHRNYSSSKLIKTLLFN
jgi:hypothetical protein